MDFIKGERMASSWEREFGVIKTIVVVIYLAMIVYAFLVFSNIPSIPYQWGQTQDMIFYVLLFESVGIFVISIFLPNILLSMDKLSERFRSAGNQAQGLKSVISQVRNVMIIVAAIGEAFSINGLVLYLLSGDSTRSWIFFVMTIIHYTITMAKLRRTRDDIEQLSKIS
jgi:hypothetical protein